jgi:hypothetical protein
LDVDYFCGIVIDYIVGLAEYCFMLAGVLSAVGNGGILGVFYFRRGRLSPAEMFLVNLGVVDILLSTASYPCAMISSFNHRWMFGHTGKYFVLLVVRQFRSGCLHIS